MAKAFSLVTWNVEHFKDDPRRVGRVVDFLKEQNSDVFALLEVEGKTVYEQLVTKMPAYQFHITEGPQVQEVLVGVKRTMTAFFTQKVEFKGGNQFLRPGALLSLRIGDENYSIVFLHTKSGSSPVGLGIRDDQFTRVLKFKKTVIDKAAGGKGKSNFLFLGDLNTMGMTYPFGKSIGSDIELKKLDNEAKIALMRRLTKNAAATWSNGSGSSIPPSDIDHVVASEHLRFKQFGGADIDVRGWPEFTETADQDTWIDNYSDHGLLYLEVLN